MPPMLPSGQSERTHARDLMNRSLENAVEEADRAGYVSAEEGRRRVDELLRQIDQRAQYGEADRERAFRDMVAED